MTGSNHNHLQAGFDLVVRQMKVSEHNRDYIRHTYALDPTTGLDGQLEAKRYRFQDGGVNFLGSVPFRHSQTFLATELTADIHSLHNKWGLVLKSYWQPGRYKTHEHGMRRPIANSQWHVCLPEACLPQLRLEERFNGEVVDVLDGSELLDIVGSLNRSAGGRI
jgi:hypothetical protein